MSYHQSIENDVYRVDSITVLLKLPRVIIHFLTEFTLHYQPLDPQYFNQDTLKGYILTTHYKRYKT